jgi:hypothetical protein
LFLQILFILMKLVQTDNVHLKPMSQVKKYK